jgi:hypothetical protein
MTFRFWLSIEEFVPKVKRHCNLKEERTLVVGFGKYSQNSNIPTLMLKEIDEELVMLCQKSMEIDEQTCHVWPKVYE